MNICSSNLQFLGKTFLMFLKILGTQTFVSDEHSLKANSPILVALFGIVILASDEHQNQLK